MIIAIYKPPSQNVDYFLQNISNMIDFYTTTYEKCMLMGDFNLKPCDKSLQNFMDKQNLFNSMKEKTCFKSLKGTCIDLIMSNQRRLLQHTHAIETGLSDFHLLAYTMLKTTFTKFPPKKISYRCYKKFNEDLFLSDLKSSLLNINYTSFQKQFLKNIKSSCSSKREKY